MALRDMPLVRLDYISDYWDNSIAIAISDAVVAALYGVETKRVNEAVRNNPDKFPQDYMFELTLEEVDILRSKFSTTKLSSKSRVLPKVFTEKSTLELNFFIGKIKHTVKRVKKSRESGENKS